jgi:hypothetical protein
MLPMVASGLVEHIFSRIVKCALTRDLSHSTLALLALLSYS